MRRLSLLLLPFAFTLTACGGSSSPSGPSGPTPPATSGFTQLAAGWSWTCGITGAGKAYCWGTNLEGQLGLGNGSADYATAPSAVAGNHTFTQITAGFEHACALDAGGAAWCWGGNFLGSVGSGSAEREFFAPAQVAGGRTFVEIKAAGYTTCARTAAGAVWCWGRGTTGELGNGGTTTSNVPVQVVGGLTFSAIGRGSYHSCGITTAGDAYCWGRNAAGEVGNGTSTSPISSPVAVGGGLKFTAIEGGQDHTCALTAAGKAYCWGGNNQGGLGDGTTTDRSVPTAVSGNLTFTKLKTRSYQSCGTVAPSTLYCWGRNAEAQLGDGSTTNRSAPTMVTGNRGLVSVTMGEGHSCGLTSAGVAWCWGENGDGQLGIGVFDGQLRRAPVMVQMPS